MIQNTNNNKFSARFKKTVSTLAQASLTSQAQYDIDYAALSQESDASNCATDAIAKGNKTMCGLFNSVLTGQTYKGVYGTFTGSNSTTPYQIEKTTTEFNPANYLLYSLSDGTLVGFKPSAKGCALSAGSVLTPELMTKTPTTEDNTGLANCIGFVDVNGVNLPNKEVTCADGTSAYSTTPCQIKPSGTSISDVFPIVFHDGTVEPATNAARAVLARGKSNVGGDNTTGTNTEQQTTDPTPPADPTPSTPQYTANNHKIGDRTDPTTWEPFVPEEGLSYDYCMSIKDQYGIHECRSDGNDRWAAAVEECGGVQNMPTDKDLYALAKIIYPNCDDNYYSEGVGSCSTDWINYNIFNNLPESFSGIGRDWSTIWSNSEKNAFNANRRYFNFTGSVKGDDDRGESNIRAVCVQPASN